MRISKKTEYAVHSVLYLAMRRGRTILLDELAQRQNISRDYLAKVLQSLSKAGIISGSVGVRGGYLFHKRPEDVTFADIFDVLEYGPNTVNCDYEKRKCDAYPDCRILHIFSEGIDALRAKLAETSMQDLLNASETSQYTVKWLKGEKISQSNGTSSE